MICDLRRRSMRDLWGCGDGWRRRRCPLLALSTNQNWEGERDKRTGKKRKGHDKGPPPTALPSRNASSSARSFPPPLLLPIPIPTPTPTSTPTIIFYTHSNPLPSHANPLWQAIVERGKRCISYTHTTLSLVSRISCFVIGSAGCKLQANRLARRSTRVY